MPFKVTMLFNMSTNKSGTSIGIRTGGWSESLYTDDTLAVTRTNLTALQIRRAALLCNGAAIVGQRIQDLAASGGATVSGSQFPGAAGTPCDIPQMSLLYRFPAASLPNVRPYILRGIPDGLVKEGEYFPSGDYTQLLALWQVEMRGWQFKAVDLLTGLTEIATIDVNGNVVLNVPNLFVANDLVTVLRSTDSFGRRFGGRFRVDTVTDSTHFKLAGWTGYPATIGGNVRPYAVIYPAIGSTLGLSPVRVTTRKVGSPFGRYRGKASTRR